LIATALATSRGLLSVHSLTKAASRASGPGIPDIDEDKGKVEEERRRVQEENRAREETVRIEDEKRRVEDERRRVEERERE